MRSISVSYRDIDSTPDGSTQSPNTPVQQLGGFIACLESGGNLATVWGRTLGTLVGGKNPQSPHRQPESETTDAILIHNRGKTSVRSIIMFDYVSGNSNNSNVYNR